MKVHKESINNTNKKREIIKGRNQRLENKNEARREYNKTNKIN